MEKIPAELAIFFRWESARVTSDVIFIVCTLIDNGYEPISDGNLDNYGEIPFNKTLISYWIDCTKKFKYLFGEPPFLGPISWKGALLNYRRGPTGPSLANLYRCRMNPYPTKHTVYPIGVSIGTFSSGFLPVEQLMWYNVKSRWCSAVKLTGSFIFTSS